MLSNTSIPLEIVFQQCYDLDYLDPEKNKEACFSCFQGIYAVPNQSIVLSDLAKTIFNTWGHTFNARTFKEALTFFKKSDGSQAFDNNNIAVLVATYYPKKETVHFSHPNSVSSEPRNYEFVEMGPVGLTGLLTKIVASTDLTDQGTGGTWGSDWRIFIRHGDETVAEAIYPVSNQQHINPQHLRDVEHVFENPAMVLSTDRVILGATKWYPGHIATIVNTSFDLFIDTVDE